MLAPYDTFPRFLSPLTAPPIRSSARAQRCTRVVASAGDMRAGALARGLLRRASTAPPTPPAPSPLDAAAAALVFDAHGLVLLRAPGRGRLLAAAAAARAGDVLLSEPPLVAVASPLSLSAESTCARCFRGLPRAGAPQCAGACGARFCSPACLAAAQASGGAHEALCGGVGAASSGGGDRVGSSALATLDAFCIEHSINFPRVAAAALAASLASGDLVAYWEKVNALASLTPGADEALPRSFHASYGLVRAAVGARLGGDTEGFFAHAFPLRSYARLMGTLRLNAFSVACPIDAPRAPAAAPAVTHAAQAPSLRSPVVSTLAAAAAAERAASDVASGAGGGGADGGAAAGCCTPPGDGAEAASCGSDAASCGSGGGDDGALRAAERRPGDGTALYFAASFINHSCDPSLEVVMAPGAHLSLRARRAIAAGEELTIAYVDDAGLLPERRRAALRHGYGFECACERCVAEARTAAGRRL